MTMMSAIVNGRCDAVLEGLRAEFGAIPAARILEAEAADFLWEARVQERYLGQHFDVAFGDDELPEELSRIAFLSLLNGRWYAGICLVDGEGCAVELAWSRSCGGRDEAEFEFQRAH